MVDRSKYLTFDTRRFLNSFSFHSFQELVALIEPELFGNPRSV